MKRFGTLVVVLLCAVLLTACSTFNDYQTQTKDTQDQSELTIFVALNDGEIFSTGLFLNDDNSFLTQLKLKNDADHANNPDAPYVIDAKYASEVTDQNPTVFRLDVTVGNVPGSVMTLDTKPFQITRTVTYFNPLTLLPSAEDADVMNHVTCYFGLETKNLPSAVTTTDVRANDDSYALMWHDAGPITITNVYPNRPIYYLIALGATLVIALIVYFVARYFYCKKPRQLV